MSSKRRTTSPPHPRTLALIRTAQCARHGGAHFHLVRVCGFDDRAETFNRFGNRAVDIALAESFAGGREDDDLVRPGFERAFKTLHVGVSTE